MKKLHPFLWIYFSLSFLVLRSKLQVTPAWFDGTLERNHAALLSLQYTNNEQSRLLQFYIPELLVRTLGLTIAHAYIVQRWLFVGLALALFHVYVRRWFSIGVTFAAVCFAAAILPFTFMNDLQESFAFLMASSVATLWAIRDGPSWSVALALVVGALNNETSLALATVYAADRFRGWRPAALLDAAWRTTAVAAPAIIYTGWIRYVTRDSPHLGGARHWRDNLAGMVGDLGLSPLDYYRALYLSMFFIFNVLWIFALLRPSQKPRFVRATLWLIPAWILPHLLTGIVLEVRQMVPLAFVVVPAVFFWMFRGELTEP